MPRERVFPVNSRRGSNSGRKFVEFTAGPTMTLSADPSRCYIVGLPLPTGQVTTTLSMECWADGTRFTTRVGQEIIEYEVHGREMRLIQKTPVVD